MKISVITATYNRKKYLERNIRSVLKQKYQHWEQIFVDGGSTDGSVEYIKSLEDNRLKILKGDRSGIYKAINSGIIESSGDIVVVLNDDDFYDSCDLFDHIIDLIGDFDGVYGDIQYINLSGSVMRYWRSSKYSGRDILLGWMPPHPSLFLRRSIYDKFGLYDVSFQISADYDFSLRINKAGVSLMYLPMLFTSMQEGGASNGNFKKLLARFHEDYRIIKSFQLLGPLTLICKILRKFKQIRI